MSRFKIVPLIVGAAALLGGGGIMLGLIMLRKPPAEASSTAQERPILVEVMRAVPKNVPVIITGFGPVAVLNLVKIAPEVSGRVDEIHPLLIVGGVVPKGEPLFIIDREPYLKRVEESRARVTQLEGAADRLRAEWENERQRLVSVERARDLAKAQFERLQQLIQEEVGTQTDVDAAERAYVTAKDQADQLANELTLYPIRVREAESALASARAELGMAEINLAKTRVDAPFDARVKTVSLKKDMVVSAGADVVTLADDSVLEISVPLDSRDARRWLRFNGHRPLPEAGWFTDLERVECTIRWTEEPDGHCWTGALDRVAAFDQSSRTVTVVVRVTGEEAASGSAGGLPLVEGMFCKVEIPGAEMEKVFEIPVHAVSFENTVYIAKDNRLQTVPIKVARMSGPSAFVSEGLEEGQWIVTTRLVNPLEQSLLQISVVDEGGAP